MKIKLAVSEESYAEVKRFLEEKGIETDEEADYILQERDRYPAHLSVRDRRGERRMIAVEDIVMIESYGRTMELHTAGETFTSSDRLYQLENMLDPHRFLRVSHSVIVAVGQIKEIVPTFHMKFILKMAGGARVDVTRNYYKKFKDYFGI